MRFCLNNATTSVFCPVGCSINTPLSNLAAAGTSAARWGALTARHRSWRPRSACKPWPVPLPSSRAPWSLWSLAAAWRRWTRWGWWSSSGLSARRGSRRRRAKPRCRRRSWPPPWATLPGSQGVVAVPGVADLGDRSPGGGPGGHAFVRSSLESFLTEVTARLDRAVDDRVPAVGVRQAPYPIDLRDRGPVPETGLG
jgi:hypothetical protein